MAETTRVTVTIPTEYLEEVKKLTDNVSAYVAEAVARRVRHELRAEGFREYQEEHGAFTDEERAAARARIEAAFADENAETAPEVRAA
ncbi:type II toxin-antitoxin system CcdA family antitoxin [Streptomyces sp. NPDC046887]|uniref:type II toxin-antitoxin system CcdA family antitoxin n=1 Tax=Streptomyces sp. NPDC046887 TaxID=3155472 RepID=UPI0033D4F2FE